MEHTIEADERTILKLFEELGTNRLPMRRVTEEKGDVLDKNARRYRFDTLSDKGLIEIERDGSLTPEGQPAMKVAVLTDEGREAIENGALEGEDAEDKRETVEDEIEELRAEVEANQQTIQNAKEAFESLTDELDKINMNITEIEDRLEAVESDEVEQFQF